MFVFSALAVVERASAERGINQHVARLALATQHRRARALVARVEPSWQQPAGTLP